MPDQTGPKGVRALPANPNLEHLKNEAKQRLRALRATAPEARLAEAQRQVARDYGFANWWRLKAHVDDQSQYGVVLMNDDVTPMEFVVQILREVFAIRPGRSDGIMLGAHRRGRALAGVYGRAEAERLAAETAARAETHGYPFRCLALPMTEVGPDVAGRVGHALAQGASAQAAARMLREEGWKIDLQAPIAWVQAPGMAGGFGLGLGVEGPGGGRVALAIPEFFGFSPPGGVEALPTLEEVFGPPPPPPPPSPEIVAIGAMVVAGASPADAAKALHAIGALMPHDSFAPREPGDGPLAPDLESAAFFRSEDDPPRLLLSLRDSEGKRFRVMRILGAEAYRGLDELEVFRPVRGPFPPPTA